MVVFILLAHAQDAWAPLRVTIECQSSGRIDACTHVQGLLDHQPVVAVVPRAAAQVVVYITVTTEANNDLVFLRAVAEIPEAPPNFQQRASVDSRLSVDAQQEAVAPALWRVLAPFVAITLPDAVDVTLTAPEVGRADTDSSPWGASTWLGGWGSWTQSYQSFDAWLGGSVYRLTDSTRLGAWVGADRSLERQPELLINGADVSIDSEAYSVNGMAYNAWNIDAARAEDQAWTVGAVLRGGADDEHGQYLATLRAHTGVEYNWFPSDDPRGNRLAAAWLIGGQSDWYHQTNALGEDAALFPTQMLLLTGSVRVDTVELGLDLAAQAELLHPRRRYAANASAWSDLTLGSHVDLNLSFNITRQAIPGPASVDRADYQQVTRLDYAEPLDVSGSVNIELHWDNTNSARNNRFGTATNLSTTGNL